MARGTDSAPTLSATQTADVKKLTQRLLSGDLGGHYYVLLLGLRTFDTTGVIERVSRGLSFSALERFARNTSLPRDRVGQLIQISPRTLVRHAVHRAGWRDAVRIRHDRSRRA